MCGQSPTPSTPADRGVSPPISRPRVRGLGAVVLALLFVGCSGDSSSAQQTATVPTEQSVIRERADRARVMGAEDAPIEMIEISDFQCPYCAQFYNQTLPALDSLYIATGKVRYVFLTYPNAAHRLAWPAVEAAFCAGAAGRFWPMHDLLFERQDQWTDSKQPAVVFRGYAEEIGVDGDSFEACLAHDRAAPLQVRDLEQVSRAGIQSTPFFVIDNSVSLQGAAPLQQFRTVLDSALAAAEEESGEGADADTTDEDGSD